MTAAEQDRLIALAEQCGAQQCGETGEFLGFPSPEALAAFAAALSQPHASAQEAAVRAGWNACLRNLFSLTDQTGDEVSAREAGDFMRGRVFEAKSIARAMNAFGPEHCEDLTAYFAAAPHAPAPVQAAPTELADTLTDERMDEIMRVAQSIANRYAFVGDAAFPRGREKLREVLAPLGGVQPAAGLRGRLEALAASYDRMSRHKWASAGVRTDLKIAAADIRAALSTEQAEPCALTKRTYAKYDPSNTMRVYDNGVVDGWNEAVEALKGTP